MEETPEGNVVALIPKPLVSQYDHPALSGTSLDARDRAALDAHRARIEGKVAGHAVDIPADVASALAAANVSSRNERVETPQGVMRREDVEYLQHTVNIRPEDIPTPAEDVTPAPVEAPDNAAKA